LRSNLCHFEMTVNYKAIMKTTMDLPLFTLHDLLLSAPVHLKQATTSLKAWHQPWRSVGVLTVLGACFWFSNQAGAATYVVTSAADAGVNTLRNIVQQANADPPGDIITFATNLNLIVINSGEIAIQNDMTISGPGATNLIIYGSSAHDRVFEIQQNNGGGVSVTISGLLFAGGYQAINGTAGTQQSPNGQGGSLAQGGIMLNDPHCSLTVSNCIMDQCFAIGGNGGPGFGGILAQPGGGGVGGDSHGGAISTGGKLTVFDCTFRDNYAAGGDGGPGTNASSSFNGSVGGKGGDAFGGAIYVDYTGDPPALTAINCTFFNNMAYGGNGGPGGRGLAGARGGDGGQGGIAEGGALYHATLNCLQGECGSMIHCTVSQNFLKAGVGGPGGIGNINGTKGPDGSGSGGGLFLRPIHFEVGSTIIAADGCIGSGTCSAPDVNGTLDSFGYNVVGATDNNSSGWVSGAVGYDQRGSVTVPLDARLGPLQDNGGQTPAMAPLAGSPAIDAGGPPPGSSLDQIGQTRPVITAGIANGGDGSDVGAFELQCSLNVPALIAAQSGNGVLISWPWPSRCFVLQQSSDLVNWVNSNYAINVVGNQNQVVINPAPGNLFFRLKK
jgi:hypothetical protein